MKCRGAPKESRDLPGATAQTALGCQHHASPILLPPTSPLIFSFHGFKITSNYSLAMLTNSQVLEDECTKRQ